jgi:P27 family predicted phage terminase small subunit
MGMRGPAPKPTALVILEGNPGKRPLNKHEPQPRRVTPKCPAYLDENAAAEWRRLIPMLRRMKVLTEADYIALGSLCQAYSTMMKAQAKLSEGGLLFKTPSGYVQQSPLLGIVNACVETITRLCREFGLTPASRSRLQMLASPSEEQRDSILDF